MDWKKTFNKGQWVIHAIFLIAVISGIGATLYALRLNHYQETEESRTLRVNSLIQNMKTDESFEKIGKYLSWAQSDKAFEKMRELKGQIAETEEILEIKSHEELSKNIRLFTKLIGQSSGMSNPEDALKVLNTKVKALEDVAKSNGFKNITIIAERMNERLSDLNPKNVGGSIQVSYLISDLKRLQNLVNGSALSDGEKNGLNARFTSMNNELELLSSLNSHARDLKAHITQASLALGTWLVDVDKRSTDLKGLRFKKHNSLIIMLAMLVGFMGLSWMGLLYLFRWQKGKIGDEVEMEVKGVIEKGIMGDQRFMMDHYSELTRNDIIALLDELKVKLNLGSLLHDGLPFAGCMIDPSFKVAWHNHLFLEQFYLSEEEVRSEAFHWDYLRDYLNLDEDPIYQALVNKIAGIYPVKMRQDEFAQSQPYEMYVTPITVNREDRVMIFFYPLVSVKEAINEQVQMAKNNLSRFMELWNDDKLNTDELKFLEKDFASNEIEDVFKHLENIFHRVNAEKTECIETIRSLEKENQSYVDTIKEMSEIEDQKKEIIKEEFALANILKDSFIQSLEKSESLLVINKSIMQHNDDLRNEATRIQQLNTESAKRGKETLDILENLEAAKAEAKKIKFDLLEAKTRLISMNNSLFSQLPPLDENLQKVANKYKDELARLDVAVFTMDKKLSQIDILVAKLQMMYEKNPIQQTNFNFQTSQKDHHLKDAISEIQKVLSAEEGKIIETFQSLKELMKEDLGRTQESQSLSRTSLDAFLS